MSRPEHATPLSRAVCATVLWAMAASAPLAQTPHTYLQKTRTFHTAAQFAQLTGGRTSIRKGVDPQIEAMLRRGSLRLPVTDFLVTAIESPLVTWIGTTNGAIRLSGESSQIEYFAGRRWLPDDHVTGIGFDGKAAWLETPQGFARIAYDPITLAEKSRRFVDRIQSRHVRWA